EALALTVVGPAATPVTLAEPTISPAAMLSVAGATVAVSASSLDSPTARPPAGAGRDNVTVRFTVLPTPTRLAWLASVRMMPGSVVAVVEVVDVVVDVDDVVGG